MRISIIGTTDLGKAMSNFFAKEHEVICFGTDEGLIKSLKSKKVNYTFNPMEAYGNSDIIFICVNTQSEIGYSTKEIHDSVESIIRHSKNDPLVVVSSSSPIGTNKSLKAFAAKKKSKIRFASNPHFARNLGSSFEEVVGSRIVIGVNTEYDAETLKNAYKFSGVQVISASPETAELSKLAINSYKGVQTSFINDLSNACEVSGANIEKIKEVFNTQDELTVLPNAGIGLEESGIYSDSESLYNYFRNDYGMNLGLVATSIDIEQKQNNKLISVYKTNNASILGNKVTVFGGSFSSKDHNIFNSPTIKLIDELLSLGAIVNVYDPVSIKLLMDKYGSRINYVNDLNMAVKMTRDLFFTTDLEEFRNLDTSIIENKNVYDGRNIFKTKIKKKLNKYYSVGR